MSQAQPKLTSFFDEADAFFDENVEDGQVAYQRIGKNPKAVEGLVNQIGNISLDDASPAERKAFYINAYNILTIHSIIKNDIPNSPMDVEGFFDKIEHTVTGQKMTLDNIEKGTLFAKFPDARIHFALVCAARGCPPLQSHAYYPEKLDNKLDATTREALNNDYFIRLNNDQKKVQVSQIFDWYRKDFLKEANSILAYINQYRGVKIPGDYGVDYYEYDWSLNDQK